MYKKDFCAEAFQLVKPTIINDKPCLVYNLSKFLLKIVCINKGGDNWLVNIHHILPNGKLKFAKSAGKMDALQLAKYLGEVHKRYNYNKRGV